jgi:3-oxoacyl-[acyl-carrier protein] reductase
MRIDFKGRTALVTGAGSGIGAAAAVGLGGAGAHVVVHYNRNEDGAAAVQRTIEEAGGSAEIVKADLTDGSAAAAMVDDTLARRGRLDILVNNAGDLVRRSSITDLTDEEFHRIMDLNLTSVFTMCRSVLPAMRRQESGAIINLTSIAARNGGGGGSVVYATSKAAVSTFTRGLAKEVALDGIRVNAVAPGVISTPFHDRHTSDDQMQMMVAGVPMRRLGTPEECVGAVLFLASEAMSGYVTGQILEINGGQLMP